MGSYLVEALATGYDDKNGTRGSAAVCKAASLSRMKREVFFSFSSRISSVDGARRFVGSPEGGWKWSTAPGKSSAASTFVVWSLGDEEGYGRKIGSMEGISRKEEGRWLSGAGRQRSLVRAPPGKVRTMTRGSSGRSLRRDLCKWREEGCSEICLEGSSGIFQDHRRRRLWRRSSTGLASRSLPSSRHGGRCCIGSEKTHTQHRCILWTNEEENFISYCSWLHKGRGGFS